MTRALDFLETPPEVYDEVFNLNMRGYFFCAQEAARSMLERGGGSIINITSVHGGGGFPRHAAYAGTKGAIIAFTRELAIELAPEAHPGERHRAWHHRGAALLRHPGLHPRVRG